MLKNMPNGLWEHIESLERPRAGHLKTVAWLESDFNETQWRVRFNDHVRLINWSATLGNGLLTDQQNEDVLDTFKYMVVGSAHPSMRNGRLIDERTSRQEVYRALRFVDFFLIRNHRFRLDRYGFDLVTGRDLDEFLFDCADGPNDAEVVYWWSRRLAAWLDEQVRLHKDEVTALLLENEELKEIDIPESEWMLCADHTQLASWRAVLLIKSMYRCATLEEYALIPKITCITEILYKDTVFGEGRMPVPPELCLYPREKYQREYPSVDVRTIERDQASERHVAAWRRTILSVGKLASFGINVFTDAIREVEHGGPNRHQASAAGRYRNPPIFQVLDGVRSGTDFILEYGPALFESYVNMQKAALSEGLSLRKLARERDIRDLLTPDALKMGVTEFCLKQSAFKWPNFYENVERWGKGKYFSEFRSKRGLLQNIQVVYGAIASVIGPITARRQDELLGLTVDRCFDETKSNIIFRNGKSGAGPLRDREVRPVPPLVGMVVGVIDDFHIRLKKVGIVENVEYLFNIPGASGMRASTVFNFNSALDAFCDFFETPLSGDGRRFYLREHQFRRFLIIVFFFGSRGGSLETIRWFVAHTDAEHLWHYLTNSVSGDIAREAAAYFLQDELRLAEEQQVVELHDRVRSALADHAEKQFGTRNFSLIDGDMLEDFLNLQIKKGLTVEPEFLTGIDGRQYKIVVKMKEGA